MLEKRSYMILLQDFYAPLLTKKQQDVLNLYYEQDLSLSEIADIMNISRQAVHDIVKRTENLLQEYENKLDLVNRFNYTQQQLELLYELLNNEKLEQGAIEKALKMIKELMQSL